MNNSEWLGGRPSAAYLGVDYNTLLGWIKAGKVPAYRLGGRIRIRKADLDNMIQPINPPGGAA